MRRYRSKESQILIGALGLLASLTVFGCGVPPSRASASAAGGAAALAGRTWVLREVDSQPAPVDPPITLVFGEDSASGSGGCNNYFANITYGEPGTLQVGPVNSTKKGCPSPILPAEQRYLQALGAAFRYTFEGKKLVLSWTPGGQQAPGRLVFAPGGPSPPEL